MASSLAAGDLIPSFRRVSQNEHSITTVLVQVGVQNAAQSRVLGRYPAERQVEFAYSIGCRKVILIGGVTPEALATRHRAEELGMSLHEISGAHALANCVRDNEKLLVLRENLLPTMGAFPVQKLANGGVLVLPADAGRQAGFERIDLARAWSGALVIEGRLVAGLLDLPEDSEASSSLLRIALQARLPEARISEDALGDGSWTIVSEGSDLALLEEKWLARLVEPAPDAPLSRLLAGKLLQRFGASFGGNTPWAGIGLGAGCALAAGAAGLAWHGLGPLGFVLVAAAVLCLEFGLAGKRLVCAPFAPPDYWHKFPWLVDLAILACGFLAIDGAWYRRLFPPLILLAILHISRGRHGNWLGRLRDRAAIALIIGAAGYAAHVEAGIMFCALLLAGYCLLPQRKRGG